MNTSNEERERLKRLVAETEWVRAGAVVDGHAIELADYARLADAFKHVIADLEAQAARVKALEVALKPFAEVGSNYARGAHHEADRDDVFVKWAFEVADFRRASALLHQGEGEQ